MRISTLLRNTSAFLFTFSSSALGAAYTFTPTVGGDTTSGDWNFPANWTPTVIPLSGDTATIPTGKTCIVQIADQSIRSVVVQGTGALLIKDKALTVGSSTASTTSNPGNGIFLQDADANPATRPTLKVYNNTTFSGGQIVGPVSTTHFGLITWAGGSSNTVTFTAECKLLSSIIFEVNVKLEPTAYAQALGVTHMYFGSDTGTSYNLTSSSTGGGIVYASSGGKVTFRRMNINGFSGDFSIAGTSDAGGGSTLKLSFYSDAANLANNSSVDVYIADKGVLDVDTNLGARHLEMERIATVDVAAYRLAKFRGLN